MRKNKHIFCEQCSKRIKSKDDLITMFIAMGIVPLHSSCYGKNLKGGFSFLMNKPLNGWYANIQSIFFLLVAIGLLIFGDKRLKYLAIVVCIPVVYRLFSYIMYERHVY
ncbi:MAG TPA: hypothetical protein VK142_10430 [Bacillota bacterium]|nr:hypothetical protein [Bacillota bacterium]